MSNLSLFSAFLIGLFGSTHCLAMCGTLAGCFGFAMQPKSAASRVGYQSLLNLGRVSCYILQGAMAGWIGYALTREFGLLASQALRLFAAVMMILMGCYLIGWWRVLRHIEVSGGRLWQRLTQFKNTLLPLDHPLKAYLLGLCWGGLPCGLVYSTLSLALSEGRFERGALLMLCFGLGTLPSMIIVGLAAQPVQAFINKYNLKAALGFIVLLMGGVMFYISLKPMGMSCH